MYFIIKIIESFEKLDLQINVELWFSENDYKPQQRTLSLNSSSGVTSLENSCSNGSTNNLSNNSGGSGATAGNSMQLLCSRTLKIRFDLRKGLHLQVPIIFDYFHLSAVLVTFHCSLLTLLPPCMLGTDLQRNLTLSTSIKNKLNYHNQQHGIIYFKINIILKVLYGQDLSQVIVEIDLHNLLFLKIL